MILYRLRRAYNSRIVDTKNGIETELSILMTPILSALKNKRLHKNKNYCFETDWYPLD